MIYLIPSFGQIFLVTNAEDEQGQFWLPARSRICRKRCSLLQSENEGAASPVDKDAQDIDPAKAQRLQKQELSSKRRRRTLGSTTRRSQQISNAMQKYLAGLSPEQLQARRDKDNEARRNKRRGIPPPPKPIKPVLYSDLEMAPSIAFQPLPSSASSSSSQTSIPASSSSSRPRRLRTGSRAPRFSYVLVCVFLRCHSVLPSRAEEFGTGIERPGSTRLTTGHANALYRRFHDDRGHRAPHPKASISISTSFCFQDRLFDRTRPADDGRANAMLCHRRPVPRRSQTGPFCLAQTNPQRARAGVTRRTLEIGAKVPRSWGLAVRKRTKSMTSKRRRRQTRKKRRKTKS